MKHKTTTQGSTDEFSAQYRSPLWQKKRLEVLEHDNYTCQVCGNKEAELQVHHAAYIKGRNVWEYKKYELLTVCEECHKKLHKAKENLNTLFLPTLLSGFRCGKLNTLDLDTLLTIVQVCDDDCAEYKAIRLALDILEQREGGAE